MEQYMEMAIELAKKGRGYTSPNPMVGCVIVKNNRVIGKGYHEKYGNYHAERNAILNCKEDLTGADLYVTLEPCSHFGKTPPCTDIIINSKIKRVIIGAMDSNPIVSGKGIEKLKENGIEVVTGVMEKECLKLNEIFFHYIKNHEPFVALKYAMTLDGKIATETGDSKWVTHEESRKNVQELRKKYSSILVGINTVKLDNPMLNCRIEEGVNPTRIVCDTNLDIPLDSNIVKTSNEIKTIVAYCNETKKEIIKILEEANVILLKVPYKNGVDLKALMSILGKMGIDSLLIEGGGAINASAIKEGIVNKVYAYIAPKFIGGKGGLSPITGSGVNYMKDAIMLEDLDVEKIGKDFLITGYVCKDFHIN